MSTDHTSRTKSRPKAKFHTGQLVMVIDDGSGPVKEPDFIYAVGAYTKKYGWSYYVSGCSYPLSEYQIRRVRRSEI